MTSVSNNLSPLTTASVKPMSVLKNDLSVKAETNDTEKETLKKYSGAEIQATYNKPFVTNNSFKAYADKTAVKTDEEDTESSQTPEDKKENSETKSVLKTISEALKRFGNSVQTDIQEMFGNRNNQ